jgi:hypothetical protein
MPLTPSAVIGVGESARALALRHRDFSDAQLARLRGVGGSGVLVVLGAADDLPWSDGAAYLGSEPSAPELYLACASEPDVPAPLLLRALLRHFQPVPPSVPIVVSIQPQLVISVTAAQRLSRERIAAWLENGIAP